MSLAVDRARPADRTEDFQRLARGELSRLYSIARRFVGDDAEDAVQECLLKAYERFDQLESPEAGPAWLARILVNCCRDRGRRASRRPEEVELDEEGHSEHFSLYRKVSVEDPLPYSDTLHIDFLGAFGTEDVTAVLLRLPTLYREPLVLVHMFGYSTNEAAEMLDAPQGTILARLHRGRKLFERQMWEYAEESRLLETKGSAR